jgi:hypothetical protein
VDADPLQDLAVLARDRLRPDLRDAQVDEVAAGEHAGLDRRPDPHDRDREVPAAELLERLQVRRVGLDHAGEARGPLLHDGRVTVDREDLVAEPGERVGGAGTEAAEAADEDGAVVAVAAGSPAGALRGDPGARVRAGHGPTVP